MPVTASAGPTRGPRMTCGSRRHSPRHPALPNYEQSQLEPVRKSKFPKDDGQVSLDASFRDVEPARDLLVRGTAADEQSSLLLARAQTIKATARFGGRPSRSASGDECDLV